MKDSDLLRRVIERSGLSARKFAVDVLIRDERTIRRWLADEGDGIPAVVMQKVKQLDVEQRGKR